MLPGHSKYINAIKALNKNVHVPILRGGVYQKGLMKNPKVYSGGFSIVFPIDANGKTYGLRCWLKNIANTRAKYQHFIQFIKQYPKYFINHLEYNAAGITVDGKKHSTVTMEWVDGKSLKKYISDNLYNKQLLTSLRSKLLEMFKYMHSINAAHGDYSHGNIIVKPDGSLVLIDYDGMYVPAFLSINYTDDNNGLEGYQSPYREKNIRLHKKLDYFSEYVIYITLSALIERPQLWKTYKVDESETRLLFTKEDFLHPQKSKIFRELRSISSLIKLISELESYCQTQSIQNIQPLENSLNKGGYGYNSNKPYSGGGYKRTPTPPPPAPVPPSSVSQTIINDFQSKW